MVIMAIFLKLNFIIQTHQNYQAKERNKYIKPILSKCNFLKSFPILIYNFYSFTKSKYRITSYPFLYLTNKNQTHLALYILVL